jgi:hypothetical protein
LIALTATPALCDSRQVLFREGFQNLSDWEPLTFPKINKHSTYTIITENGRSAIGMWVEETVNILDDYRAAFGKEPPPTAGIAIMNDSDNTGEMAVSYVDYIEVFK